MTDERKPSRFNTGGKPAAPQPTPAAANAGAAGEAPSFADLVRYNAEAHIANAHIETLDKLAAADAENADLRARVEALTAALQPSPYVSLLHLAEMLDNAPVASWETRYATALGYTIGMLKRLDEVTRAAQARGGEEN